ncbi:alpha-D-ribose 1-methylphosphonate 5-triphosphate diphosphatase [Rhodovulum sulfidophilum]|uniref:alpha-D-ribose 1-methylphosphonate 5-triphosphate diphosphatase n=1 Tax=Rhodovulum sulfidophilum TaxID=35806 RepID=UPI001921B753|nr:alpha-D-ribose 1-methylphosphonate 5-triphosphate diphosphatase [Rhodovulum sulfidophilum]MBL3572727.1 alpha-D-ribose 1-methylphosphonate 5-triphosphate diphosphatase [Rhodovulum sulfidophilum]MCE8433374.1 alpha-D-ribose 1-methylphosphonate 5-triphosphate diphosphatase [Rhodovulum sulfidophilum]MCF4117164.1 alpha-D-ribose 1-methylphosphonate 5-triphosphate diphosphatase [Rhodovulum sulfidophilum]
MPQFLHPLRFTGARILRDGEMQRRSIAIAEGRITKGPLPEVDLTGYLILPGIVDLHADTVDRHLPRVASPLAPDLALAASDRDAAAHGVTTGWLAQDWSWEGGHRAPDRAEALMAALAAYRPRMLTDLRLQLRCEIHTVGTAERLIEAIGRYRIDYVVFHNRLDAAAERAQDRPWPPPCRADRDGLAAAQAAMPDVPRYLCRLAEAFDAMGVLYGSHGDPDGETRERFSMIGARIAEFPTTRRAAAAAKAMNDPVLLGAPDVMRDGSQPGQVPATDLIAQGLCDALVSDFYYPALPHAVWRLVDLGLKTLPQAWAMVSQRPAEILRLPDRGRLDIGKRADLCVINERTRAVEMTIVGGRLTYLAGEAAHRFVHRIHALDMAAE